MAFIISIACTKEQAEATNIHNVGGMVLLSFLGQAGTAHVAQSLGRRFMYVLSEDSRLHQHQLVCRKAKSLKQKVQLGYEGRLYYK
jgi:hypothetical protein